MTDKLLGRIVVPVIAGLALLVAGYFIGTHQTIRDAASEPSAATPSEHAIDSKTNKKVLYWHDPMVPNQHFDKPGKSPFMDMQLQPVYADDGGGQAGIRIDPSLQQNLGVRYATVHRQDTSSAFDAVASTQFDESRASVVQSRVTGYIDRLYANAPMQRIAKGSPIASLFVPDWLAPQEEYLAIKRAGSGLSSLLEASRARMRALSIPDGVIAALDRTGKVQTHIVLASPESGVISELNVRDGAMVVPGQTVAKVAGLSKLWLAVEIPEALATRVQPGMTVDATLASTAGHRFTGRIREILPGISTTSRTLQARLEIDNTALELTPGMLLRVRVAGQTAVSRLLVPSEAIITTGKRSLVIVKRDDGRLQPVSIEVGADFGNETEVLGGVGDGDTVVASGQFLIDSEASLKSVLPRMQTNDVASAAGAGPSAALETYETTGKVEKVTDGDITFSHQPVPALGWGAMTMAFDKPASQAFREVLVGQTVHFVFKQTDDGYQLVDVEPLGDLK